MPPAPGSLRFEDLQKSYNFLHPAGRIELFTGIVLGLIESRPVRVLDIGCGSGIAQNIGAQQRIAAAAREAGGEFWGVEPDPTIKPPAWITHYQTATMETADIPEASIDLAYSCLVMEHVTKPAAFMSAVYRCLKPGGVYFFMTINARHYFARITRTVKALHMDEFLLRRVRPKEQVEEYHYPVAYRFNSERIIGRVCAAAGFEPPRYVYAEPTGPETYFPGPLRPIYLALHAKRSRIRNPRALLELYCLVRKPG